MTRYNELCAQLRATPQVWLVSGVAGFIGSNLLEALLTQGQVVVGLDNFSTGHKRNLDEIAQSVGPEKWENFSLIEGDIRDLETCRSAVKDVDYVLHQAALGSVPRSIENPIATNATNVDGFLNMLVASRDANVRGFVYAASSSTYGDHPGLPKVEDVIGRPLSPYAITKYVNELYADVFAKAYNFRTIGLRYFNVFGRRQDPEGPYAAVIPKWIAALIQNEPVWINGDGETSRDFCYVQNVVQANLLGATTTKEEATNQVYNVAVGERTTLNDLLRQLQDSLLPKFPHLEHFSPSYRDFRRGDVRHSQADISKARNLLGYDPSHRLSEGLTEAMEWYVELARCSVRR